MHRAQCQICKLTESKYACSRCNLLYCSVPCYKQHKESTCNTSGVAPSPPPERGTLQPVSSELEASNGETYASEPIPDPVPLRPLTSLKWPYVPEESAYPDPLTRDDPQPLQLRQYEAIATSPRVREVFASHPRLPDILTAIDTRRGADREAALERALGLASSDIVRQASGAGSATPLHDDVLALRKLTEAIEAAVRGGKQDVLGVEWGD